MTVVDILSEEFKKEFVAKQLAPLRATPTPLASWNKNCRYDGGQVGIAKGWFIVIGGNPKFGKSILALEMATTAMQSGEVVGFISLEMTAHALAARFYAMATKTPVWKMEKGSFRVEQFDRVWRQISPNGKDMAFIVDDTPMIDLDAVYASMLEMAGDGIEWFVVDYLQLIGLGNEEEINKAVTATTSRLRHFARQLDVTVIALSQFNRETAKNYHDTPQVQGLHGGMIVEASADQIVLIDHSRYEKEGKLARTFLVLTQRHGPGGDIPIEWDFETLSVREGLLDEEHLWPK